MLHQLPTDQLRVGMFVQSMDCSWLSSPFWRRRFLIETASDIAALKSSGIRAVTIDDARGAAPPKADQGSDVVEAAISREFDAEPMPADRPKPRRRHGPTDEMERARAVIERSRVEVTRMFHEARMGQAVQMAVIGPLVDDIAESVARDVGAMLRVTRLKNKNEYTYLHSVAVCALMINLARRLGLAESDARRIGMAGLLHDIGKMGVPDSILDKPGALDEQEFRTIRTHPQQGHALLVESSVDALALDVCLHHHERIDGRGYPFGKKAEEISIYARMGAICDVYDAVTSNRPYKQAWSPGEALAKMRSWTGHFDPDILEAFIDSIGIPPLHSLVRLHSNRLAIVTELDPEEPSAPDVRAFYSIPDQAFMPLATVSTIHGDPIVQMERGDYWFGASWEQVSDRVCAGLDPEPTDFEPARPYIALGDRRRTTVPSGALQSKRGDGGGPTI